MRSSIEVRPYNKTGVIITSNSPYAAIHQFGGNIKQDFEITPKMRKFFWAKHYETKDEMWKALALKKGRIKREFDMPARPYITLTEEDLKEIIEILTMGIMK